MDIVRSALLWAIVALVASTQFSSAAETRIALIITNAAYSGQVLSRLDNTYKDGEIVSEALRKVGFEVLPVVRDANQQAMRAALNDFARRLRRAGADAVGFFYYSGHGAALAERGENYLIPTGAQIEETSELSFNAVGLTEVVRLIEDASPKAGFVVIDACRDIPFRGRRGGGPKGFVVQSNAEGIIIGFATRPGETALDSNVYSTALATSIATPGLDASAVFKDVQRKVAGLTGNKQIPWIEDGLLSDFRFASVTLGPTAVSTGSIGGSAAINPGAAKDDVETVRRYQKAADAGDASGIRNLGFMYENGRGVAKDDVEAVRLFRKAADAGNSDALTDLGFMYEHGRGVAKDETEAVRWYRKAADAGNTTGIKDLGVMYADGRGIAKDEPEAVRLYRKAADAGDASGMRNLGLMYENGRGVAKDDAEAVRWFRKAADAGVVDAMTDLGFMTKYGRGVAKDDTEAVRWYRKAADAGEDYATNNLGNMYRDGQGVAKDDVEAMRLYRKAADAGNALAMSNLGYMYQNGRGVKQDNREARIWYEKAVAAGSSDAKDRLSALNQSEAAGQK